MQVKKRFLFVKINTLTLKPSSPAKKGKHKSEKIWMKVKKKRLHTFHVQFILRLEICFFIVSTFNAFQILSGEEVCIRKLNIAHMLVFLWTLCFVVPSKKLSGQSKRRNIKKSKESIDRRFNSEILQVQKCSCVGALVVLKTCTYFTWRYNCHILPGSIKAEPRCIF